MSRHFSKFLEISRNFSKSLEISRNFSKSLELRRPSKGKCRKTPRRYFSKSLQISRDPSKSLEISRHLLDTSLFQNLIVACNSVKSGSLGVGENVMYVWLSWLVCIVLTAEGTLFVCLCGFAFVSCHLFPVLAALPIVACSHKFTYYQSLENRTFWYICSLFSIFSHDCWMFFLFFNLFEEYGFLEPLWSKPLWSKAHFPFDDFTCARSLYADLLFQMSLSRSLEPDAVRPLVQNLCHAPEEPLLQTLSQDLLRKISVKISASGIGLCVCPNLGMRVSCSRSLCQDLCSTIL